MRGAERQQSRADGHMLRLGGDRQESIVDGPGIRSRSSARDARMHVLAAITRKRMILREAATAAQTG